MSDPRTAVAFERMDAMPRPPSDTARPRPVTDSTGTATSPIFIVGSGRSGTTLTASILDRHSALATGPETGFFRTFPAVRERVLNDPAWPDQAVRFLMSLNRMMGNVAANYGLSDAQLRDTLQGRSRTPGAVLDALCGTYAAMNGARRWVEQTPTHILSVRQIRQEWPEAPIIRLLRDPRGVAASYLKVPFGPGTAVGAAFLWQLHDDAARATLDGDPHATIVSYEALLANPQAEVRRICAFIGEAFEPGMLGSPEAAEQPATERPSWLTSVVIDSSRAEAWHAELSAPDQERVTLICGVGMERHGYSGARTAPQSVTLHPYDEPVSTATALLEEAADRGIAFRPPSAETPNGRRRPILFWGRPRRLRWTDSPVGSTPRSLGGWARVIVRGRLRKQPLLWVTAATSRPPHDSWGERVGDTFARILVPYGTQAEALRRIVPSETGVGGTPTAEGSPSA